MKRRLWGGFLVLLLAACGTNSPDLPQTTDTFKFTVDPAAQSVEFASVPVGAVTAQAENGSRVLVPGADLGLEDYTFSFLPGNLLAIDASFKNVSKQTFTHLMFSRAAGSSNIVSSTEPEGLERLAPGESTGSLRFTVMHKGQPFTYEAEANAKVVEPGGTECTDPVNIPDDILRQNIRDALNKPEGDITCADLAGLTELRVIGADITGDFLTYARNFEGLQFATNLTSLFIGGENFSEGVLNPVADLKNLTNLDLFSGSTTEADLGALSNLTNLTKFSLTTESGPSDYNGPLELNGLNVFSTLTKLTELRFGDVAVSDIGPLRNLTDLTVLEISNSQGDGTLSNLEPLASLTKLETLRLSSNQIRNLDALSGLTKLTQLNIKYNLILDLTPLVQNEQLGSDDDVIDLAQNCLAKDEAVKRQAQADVDTLEGRNPAVTNVFVDLNDPNDYNPSCEYQ